MGRVAAIGEQMRVQGLTLAGVVACPAESPDQALAAWRSLPADIDLVILSPMAAASIPDDYDVGNDGEPEQTGAPLRVVMPQWP